MAKNTKKNNTFWTFADSFEGDKVVWIIVLLLILFSIVCMFSSSSRLLRDGMTRLDLVRNQFFVVLAGLAVIIVCYNIKNIAFFRWCSQWGFLLSLGMLALLDAHVDLPFIKALNINNAYRILSIGGVTEKRGPGVLNAAVCSRAVADTITRALKAVTEEGTAKRLKDAKCAVAGKTGTSFGTYENGQYSDAYGRRKYQGTFVGFFPAEDPQYSIICTVYSKPTGKSFQGGGIPARAIRTVIDKLYNIDPYFREELKKEETKDETE